MSFELFTDQSIKDEVKEMLKALKGADYAVSTLSPEAILRYATTIYGPVVTVRRLKNGNTKVKLKEKP